VGHGARPFRLIRMRLRYFLAMVRIVDKVNTDLLQKIAPSRGLKRHLSITGD
jgi:hypothetical protein